MRSREVLFGFLFSLSTMVSAQTDTLHIPSIREIYKHNNWLAANNPVGLSFNRFRSFSVAEAGYSYHNGNLGNVSIPASTSIYSVYSESFQTVNKVSLYFNNLQYTAAPSADENGWYAPYFDSSISYNKN